VVARACCCTAAAIRKRIAANKPLRNPNIKIPPARDLPILRADLQRQMCRGQRTERKVFFSEEKKQKTFIFWWSPNCPAMAWIFPRAEE
jgi:hypothetical protein